jgi:hypothetical protein
MLDENIEINAMLSACNECFAIITTEEFISATQL